MFLGEELGSDVAFKKVLALILRGNVSQWKALKHGICRDNAKGLIGGQGVPGPQVEGLVRQSQHPLCDDIHLHFVSAAVDRHGTGIQPSASRFNFVVGKSVSLPAKAF